MSILPCVVELVMSFFSFFWPQVLEKVVSPISGEIKVFEQFGKRRLEIGGMTQSGGLVEKIWKKGLKELGISEILGKPRLPAGRSGISEVLILGLGCGTVAKLLALNTIYHIPYTRIVGVELDPEIIKLGEEYFGLGEIENLEIVIADAVSFVNRQWDNGTMGQWNLILVDLYQGWEIPQNCRTKKFLKKLRELKGSKGWVIFNRLYSKDKKRKTDEFVVKCREIFKEVKTTKAVCNLMIYCS